MPGEELQVMQDLAREKVCISCGRPIANVKGSTSFKCPKCGSYEIVRCESCRRGAVKYVCPNCGFSGPN